MPSRVYLSQRVLELEPSATLAMSTRAKQLAAEGKPVISLSIGEPDFKTPPHICEAAKAAIDAGMHGYTAVAGIPDLRKAMAAALTRSTGVPYEPNQTVATQGGKYGIYLALLALIDPGDEVIIPSPYWVSYPEMVRLAGGHPVIIPTREEDHFALDPRELEKAVNPRTKLLILNTPSNPSGQVLPPRVINELGRIMEKKKIWCLSDEIYDQLIYAGNRHKSIASVSDYCREHTVVSNGCSKAYAMTGWRMGYIGAPRELAQAVDDLAGQTSSNICTVTQAAAVAALSGPQDCVASMRAEFEKRGKLITKLLNEIPGFETHEAQGAFYSFPNISWLFGHEIAGREIESTTDFATLALEKAFVAVVPGVSFGAPDHIRVSYATSEENIIEGCRRLRALVEGTLEQGD